MNPPKPVKKFGKDDMYSEYYGNYHVHLCKRCSVPVACFNGPNCDMGQVDGYCSQDCYDFKTREYSRSDQPVVDL